MKAIMAVLRRWWFSDGVAFNPPIPPRNAPRSRVPGPNA